MGRKSSQTITKSKQVATDKKQINVRKRADRKATDCLESVS